MQAELCRTFKENKSHEYFHAIFIGKTKHADAVESLSIDKRHLKIDACAIDYFAIIPSCLYFTMMAKNATTGFSLRR